MNYYSARMYSVQLLYLKGRIRGVRLIIISEKNDSLVTVLRGTVRKRERDNLLMRARRVKWWLLTQCQ